MKTYIVELTARDPILIVWSADDWNDMLARLGKGETVQIKAKEGTKICHSNDPGAHGLN